MKNASTELSREDTTAVRQVVLPIVITHLHGHMEAVGTCWIFCTAGREALAFSASHIFDYVARLEGRHDNYAASMPDILRPEKPPSLELQFTRLQAFYQATDDMGYAAHIVAAHRDGAHDLCVCHLMLGDDVPADVRFSRCIELATALPSVGTNVQVCGYSSLGDTSYTADPTTGVIAGRLNPMVEFRGGEVVYAHPLGRPMGPPGPASRSMFPPCTV